MKKKNNGESSGDESDLCKNCKKSKLRALGKRNSNKSNNEKVEKAAPTIRKQLPHEDRLEYLISMSQEFMTDDELKVLKKVFKGQFPDLALGRTGDTVFKINGCTDPPKMSKACQTKLSHWREPFSSFDETNPKGICKLSHRSSIKEEDSGAQSRRQMIFA